MELLELQSVWKKVVDEEKTAYQIKEEDIRSMIQKKSKIVLSQFLRELALKRWFLGTMGGIAILASLVYLLGVEKSYMYSSLFSSTEMTILLAMIGASFLYLFFQSQP